MNSTQVADLSSPTYPYKHHLETTLSYSNLCKDTFLRSEMYHKDKNERKKWIEESKECFFSLKPSIDIFSSDKFLPPMVSN